MISAMRVMQVVLRCATSAQAAAPRPMYYSHESLSVYVVQERLRQFQEHMDTAVGAVDAGKQEQRNLENTHVQDK